MTITFNNTTSLKKVPAKEASREFGDLQEYIVPVFSGKTALAIMLEYFRNIKKLEDKTAEVLVPSWLGQWVYMAMLSQTFPTREFNPRVRGLIMYHQWGFPQRAESILRFAKERDLFVIEDCAHAFEGCYKGQRLGTFGDAAIFSMAKFFPCVVGGAVYSKDSSIQEFLKHRVKKAGTLENEMFREREAFDRDPHSCNIAQQYAVYPELGGCVPEALDIVRQSIVGGALQERKENVQRLRSELQLEDEFGLFEDGVLPWVVPFFFERETMLRIVQVLRANDIEAGIFHFDVNRNMLDSDYRECIALPCHDGITETEMQNIIRIVRGAL